MPVLVEILQVLMTVDIVHLLLKVAYCVANDCTYSLFLNVFWLLTDIVGSNDDIRVSIQWLVISIHCYSVWPYFSIDIVW